MSAPDPVYQSCFDLRWHFDPAEATAAGVTTQNERLGDYDVESMRAHLAAFKSLSHAVEGLEVETLEEEIDRTALLNDLRGTIARFEIEQPHVRNPGFWLSHLYNALHALMERADAPPADRARAMAARLRAVPAFLASAAATLSDPPPVLRETAEQMVDAGEALIGHAARFAGAHAPSDDLATAASEAEAALARFGLLLKTELATSDEVQAFAVGEENFNRRLHVDHALQSSAPELWRYGLHLVEDTEQQLARLARQLGGSDNWRPVVEEVRASSPVTGDLVAAYREAMIQSRDFVRERGLATIPEASLDVVATPEFLVPLIPFAAYSPPGPYSPDRTGRFYVTAGTSEPPVRSRLELASQALHEGVPGHHLHMLTAQSLASDVRRLIWTPLTVEGWALYCEDMMAEEGFFQDPAARMMQLVHLLWRAVRILLDIGLHTRNMSPDAAVLYLMDKVPMTAGEARSEVRRYCAMPTYQLCYAVGRHELLALRRDYQARLGSSFTLRRFHDDLMRYGGLPVSLARWGLMAE